MLRWTKDLHLALNGDSFYPGPFICFKTTSYTLGYQWPVGRDHKLCENTYLRTVFILQFNFIHFSEIFTVFFILSTITIWEQCRTRGSSRIRLTLMISIQNGSIFSKSAFLIIANYSHFYGKTSMVYALAAGNSSKFNYSRRTFECYKSTLFENIARISTLRKMIAKLRLIITKSTFYGFTQIGLQSSYCEPGDCT